MNEQAIADAAVELAEHLKTEASARLVDPLVKSLRMAVANRFRRQFQAIKRAGLQNWRASLHIRDAKLAHTFTRVTSKAYTAGADTARRQLVTKVREARVPDPKKLPGPTRDAHTFEDELDDSTQKQLAGTVGEAYVGSMTTVAVLELVRQQFKEWAAGEDSRSETIALNEVSAAYHGGMGAYAGEWRGGNGPVLKTWLAEPDACDECQGNADMGAIDSEAAFDTGDQEPPVHPNCRCSLEYSPDETFEQ